MKLNKLGKDVYLLVTNHNSEILYSFDQVAAGAISGVGYFRIGQDVTAETEAHINDYLLDNKPIILSLETVEKLFLNRE